MQFLQILLRSAKTVFSFSDLLLLWGESNPQAAYVRVHYYLKKKYLYPLRRGLYAKDKNYDKRELATRIFTPSYISFETVLTAAGVNFQYYEKITLASYLSREICVDGQAYSFKKIKGEILTNNAGIDQDGIHSIASPERAVLDTLYVNKEYHFDNLDLLNWGKIFELLPLYKNKKLNGKINKLHLYFKEQNNS